MKIVAKKLDMDMHGPDYFGIMPEQAFIELGYVWNYEVYDEYGTCVRGGLSKIQNFPKLREYILSGMGRLEWEAIHGTD